MRRRVIALSLSVAIIGTGNGISTFGTTVGADSQTNVETTEVNAQSGSKLVETSQIGLQPEVVKEIKKERTENSNTYLMSDGSKKLELFAMDIRYKENGKWVDYDTELVGLKETDIQSLRELNISGASYSYANAQGNIKHYFADKVDEDTPVIMTKDDYEIRFAPVTKEKVVDSEELESLAESSQIIGGVPESAVSESEESDSETSAASVITNEAAKTVSDNIEPETITDDSLLVKDEISFTEINADDTSEIVYSNANESIEYRYQSLTNGVKESIVLNEKPDTNVFEFAMDIPGMEAVVSEETNEIHLKDAESKEVLAVVAPPNIISGTDIPDYDHVEYELTEKSEGSYRLDVVVDNEYLENAMYPITIDPTYVWRTESMVECRSTISAGGAASSVISVENGVSVMNGSYTKGRVYYRFLGLNEELLGKYIYQSYFLVYPKTVNGTLTVGASRVLGDWNVSTLKWNNQPNISDVMYDEENAFVAEGNTYFMLTDWTKEIAAGEITDDYGIALSCSEETTSSVAFYSPYYESKQAMLYVYYKDVEEVEAGYDGTFAINMETTETNQVRLFWEKYSDEINEYDIYVRTGNSFEYAGKTTEFEYTLDSGMLGEHTDVRVMAIDVDDANNFFYAENYLSNIVSIVKYTETVTDDEGNETYETYFEQTIMDTDGDELEDGYEIWDFKTLWNTETADSTEDNKTYDLDTDDDGFPDSYEVFTLGTNPAVANRYDENNVEIDSDSDGWSDYKEYQEGTDPWIVDSDFDGTIDKGDGTPRKTNSSTSQTRAAQTQVHVGLYDRQYSETEDGVTYTYVTNIYRGEIKKIAYDYGNSSLNKTIKYFYDESGNNTAIIESYDESYDQYHTQTICITYTYDSDNNVIFICDQSTRYTMNYANGEMTSLLVGNQELVLYDNEFTDNSGENGDTSDISIGDVISVNENTTIYGREKDENDVETGRVGTVRTVTTVYKVADDDTTSTHMTEEIYYDQETTPSYKTEYTSDGNIKAFHDYSITTGTDVVYTCVYGENGISVKKGEETIKTVTEESDEENGTSTVTTTYNFKDVKNQNTSYSSVITTDIGEDDLSENSVTLYNGDISRFSYDSEKEESVSSIYSNLYDKNILQFTQTNPTSTTATFDIDIYAEDKSIDYVYDLTGNITRISVGDEVKYEYTYDAHGRLTGETDYVDGKYHEYIYNTTGNINAHWTYELDAGGQPAETGTVKYSTYTNTDWPDQLSSYGGETITYDRLGNPTEYLNGWEFEWERGRTLSGIRFNYAEEGNESSGTGTNTEEGLDVTYKYDENGLRTYKDTETTTTTYEWNESTLIRETVTYKATNRTYDIWYFYDNIGSVIGFEYSQINDLNEKSTTRIYYEKDLQGNVIGLLDSRGAEIATYFYDAWGNITTSMCYEGYEVPFALNHITYRGYYRDAETGFYYLQSRYYDSEICRFINADETIVYNREANNYNLFLYCRNMSNTYYTKYGINQKFWMQKKYNGQETGAYGYGGIVDCSKYLKDRYGGNITVYQQKALSMSAITMNELENNANNCILTAITRIFDYYQRNGYSNIDSTINNIYDKVKKVAVKYGYTNKKGTWPTKINNIVNEVADNYGYEKSKCNSIYVWSFNNEVKKEIDAARPVIMNITTGYYGNHSVTVCGYKIYRKKKTLFNFVYYQYYYMIAVYDGWTDEIRYIDYNAFAQSNLGSFSKIKMKK